MANEMEMGDRRDLQPNRAVCGDLHEQKKNADFSSGIKCWKQENIY